MNQLAARRCLEGVAFHDPAQQAPRRPDKVTAGGARPGGFARGRIVEPRRPAAPAHRAGRPGVRDRLELAGGAGPRFPSPAGPGYSGWRRSRRTWPSRLPGPQSRIRVHDPEGQVDGVLRVPRIEGARVATRDRAKPSDSEHAQAVAIGPRPTSMDVRARSMWMQPRSNAALGTSVDQPRAVITSSAARPSW